MSTPDIALLTRQANLVGNGSGVICKYEWSSREGRFQWSYYRRGHFVGSTARLDNVITKMQHLTSTK